MSFSMEEVEGAVSRGVSWLKMRQLECGGWGACDSSQTGLTGLVVVALREAGLDPDDISISQAVKFIIERQRKDGFFQWTTATSPGSYYGSARAMLGVLVGSERTALDMYRRNVELGIFALMNGEMPCGGWEANPGGGLSHWASAEVLFAIFFAGRKYVEEIWKAPMHYYVRMRRWFSKLQSMNGSWDNNCLDCTARVMLYLSLYGYRGPELRNAVEFVISHQKEDRIGDTPWATAWSLLGLLSSAGLEDAYVRDVIEKAVAALLEAQLDDGGWPVFFDAQVPFESVTAVAVWALSLYRNLRRGLPSIFG
ncbi:MAG: terpene cyclase/mutase family protein [Crenarchaeota archaeon]|nr:terpene cyclase/mutase family protein [Thermoproteota archaeon]